MHCGQAAVGSGSTASSPDEVEGSQKARWEVTMHESFRQPKKSGCIRQFHYGLSSPSVLSYYEMLLVREDALREFGIPESTVHTGNGDTCIRGKHSVIDHVVV
jgi:hypothetical protein